MPSVDKRIFALHKVILIIFTLCLCATALFTGAFPLTKLTPNFHRMGMFDWPIFIEAAKNFINTGSLYYSNTSLYGPNAAVYKFPPLFASILVQLLQSGVSEDALKYGMGIAQLISYFGAIAICLGLSGAGNKLSMCVAAFIFVATFEPFVDNFIGLQLEVFILLLLCATLYFLTKNSYVIAGVMIGVAISLKLYPVFFCLYFLLQKHWRGLAGVAFGLLLAALFSILVIGYEQHWLYYTKIAPVLFTEPIYNSYQNVSITNFFYSLGLGGRYPLLAGYAVLLTGIFILFFFRNNQASTNNKQGKMLVAFSLLVSTFVLGSKNSWGNYQLLLALPIITLLGISLDKKYVDRFSIAALVIACVMIFLAPPHRLFAWVQYFFSSQVPMENLFVYMRALAGVLVFLVSARLYGKVMHD